MTATAESGEVRFDYYDRAAGEVGGTAPGYSAIQLWMGDVKSDLTIGDDGRWSTTSFDFSQGLNIRARVPLTSAIGADLGWLEYAASPTSLLPSAASAYEPPQAVITSTRDGQGQLRWLVEASGFFPRDSVELTRSIAGSPSSTSGAQADADGVATWATFTGDLRSVRFSGFASSTGSQWSPSVPAQVRFDFFDRSAGVVGGSSQPGAAITVAAAGGSKDVITGDDGHWTASGLSFAANEVTATSAAVDADGNTVGTLVSSAQSDSLLASASVAYEFARLVYEVVEDEAGATTQHLRAEGFVPGSRLTLNYTIQGSGASSVSRSVPSSGVVTESLGGLLDISRQVAASNGSRLNGTGGSVQLSRSALSIDSIDADAVSGTGLVPLELWVYPFESSQGTMHGAPGANGTWSVPGLSLPCRGRAEIRGGISLTYSKSYDICPRVLTIDIEPVAGVVTFTAEEPPAGTSWRVVVGADKSEPQRAPDGSYTSAPFGALPGGTFVEVVLVLADGSTMSRSSETIAAIANSALDANATVTVTDNGDGLYRFAATGFAPGALARVRVFAPDGSVTQYDGLVDNSGFYRGSTYVASRDALQPGDRIQVQTRQRDADGGYLENERVLGEFDFLGLDVNPVITVTDNGDGLYRFAATGFAPGALARVRVFAPDGSVTQYDGLVDNSGSYRGSTYVASRDALQPGDRIQVQTRIRNRDGGYIENERVVGEFDFLGLNVDPVITVTDNGDGRCRFAATGFAPGALARVRVFAPDGSVTQYDGLVDNSGFYRGSTYVVSCGEDAADVLQPGHTVQVQTRLRNRDGGYIENERVIESAGFQWDGTTS